MKQKENLRIVNNESSFYYEQYSTNANQQQKFVQQQAIQNINQPIPNTHQKIISNQERLVYPSSSENNFYQNTDPQKVNYIPKNKIQNGMFFDKVVHSQPNNFNCINKELTLFEIFKSQYKNNSIFCSIFSIVTIISITLVIIKFFALIDNIFYYFFG